MCEVVTHAVDANQCMGCIYNSVIIADTQPACPLSPAGYCAARGPRAHHRVDQLADWPRSAVRFPIKCSNHELSYALLARARESSELCSHFRSLPPVAARDLSTNVTWHAHSRKPEEAPRRPRPRIGPVLGEGGVNKYTWSRRRSAAATCVRATPAAVRGDPATNTHLRAVDWVQADVDRPRAARPRPQPERSPQRKNAGAGDFRWDR